MVQLDQGSNGDSISAVPAMLGFSTHVRPASSALARHLQATSRQGQS